MLSKFRDNFLLEAVVFVSGALVMVYEIIGSRILAPYIGTSTYVWTSLIGVILASLSLGYWLGGKMADREPHLRVLSAVMFFAGACIAATILFQNIVLGIISTTTLGLEIKSILATLILFAPASVFFGFVTPYAVRLKMQSVEDAGKTVGRLYALSTVGSILGTFSAGFLMLPFVGSVRTLYFLAGILFALSLMIAPFKLTTTNLFVLIMFPCAIIFNEVYAYSMFKTYELNDFDTHYNRLQVYTVTNKETHTPMRVLVTDPASTQSAMFLESDQLALKYAEFYHLLRFFKPDFQHTLIIGGAAYSFPKEYLRTYPDKQIDVVEIDPQMTEIARRFFRLQDNPNLKIFHEDGRIFLNQNENKYDVVLIDAFNSLYSIPFQLTTIESVRQVEKSLSNDGVVILNMISAIDGKGSEFLQAEYETYRQVFPQVYIYKVKGDEPNDLTQNLILVATKSTRDFSTSSDEKISALLKNRYENPIVSNVPVLTDDYAPVEYYTSFAQQTIKK